MKRSFCFVLSFAAAVSLLCGCGMYRTDGGVVVETPYVSPVIEPSMTPIISPDVEDGIVNDRDGIIEDDTEDRGTGSADSAMGNTSGDYNNRTDNRISGASPKP